MGVKYRIPNTEFADGIAQALIIGEEFLDGAPSILALGDNIFYGNLLYNKLVDANSRQTGSTIFAHHVAEP